MNRSHIYTGIAFIFVLMIVACDTTSTALPTAPTQVSATSTEGAVQLSWTDASTNETNFVIYRAENSSTATQIGEVGADITVYLDTDADVGVQYTYSVGAKGQGGTSALVEASGGKTVGPAPLDTAVTGRLSDYDTAYGAYAVASEGVAQISDPEGGPEQVLFGDKAQYGVISSDGRINISLKPLANDVLSDFDYCGTQLRAAFLFAVTTATVPAPTVIAEVKAFAALTNTGGRDPFFDAREGDEVGMWLYVPTAISIHADCTASDGVLWHYQLDLKAGWNAIAMRVDAVTGTFPTEQTLTTNTSADLVWATAPFPLP